MWLRLCLLVSVTLSVVNAMGIYRLVHPAAVPGWLQRFPNSRILFNRDYYNHLYRRLILRDPYWHARIHRHRRVYLPRQQLPLLRLPQYQTTAVNVPSYAFTGVQRSSPDLIGRSNTYVKYTSPSLARYNTPWERVSASYRDYGAVQSTSEYDRPFFGGSSSAAVLPAAPYNEQVFSDVGSGVSRLYDDSGVFGLSEAQMGSAGVDIGGSLSQQSVSVLPGSARATIVPGGQHALGSQQTFVKYSSPDLQKYNTPWTRVSAQLRDYGEVGADYGYGDSVGSGFTESGGGIELGGPRFGADLSVGGTGLDLSASYPQLRRY